MAENEEIMTPLEKLAKININVATPASENGSEYIIDGEPQMFEQSGALVCHVLPYYRGNSGFYHVFEGPGEAIVLKGVYGDATRVVKKGISLSEARLELLARTLAEADRALEGSFEYWLLIDGDESYIAKATPCEVATGEKLDSSIPRPMTGSEYSDAMTGNHDTTLFSKSFFYNLFPETVSTFTKELAKSFPEILSPFFLAFDAKVGSPSVICSAQRLYVNISALLPGFNEAKINPALFAEDYMPWQNIFKNVKQAKPELFITSLMDPDEIDEFIATLEKDVLKKGNYAFFDNDYLAPLSSISMMGLLLNFLFQEQVAYIGYLTGFSRQESLEWIYKTRATSFFNEGKTLPLPEYFDPTYEQKEVTVPSGAAFRGKEEILGSISAFKRWRKGKKIMRVLTLSHVTLDARDRLLAASSTFHKAVRNAILHNGEYVTNKKRIKNASELFLFNLQDMRKLVNDTYYSGLAPVLEYRRSLAKRAMAQHMPYEIYEADIPYSGMISEEQVFKAMEADSVPCLSRGDRGGIYTVKSINDAQDGDAVLSRAMTLHNITLLKKPSAVITELAPAFSYITEYCILYDIPLYYGIRYSETVLSDKRIELHSDKLVFVK